MQRAALCLVAVLVLLAGCSGGTGGGSDATPTEALTTTQTPVATASPSATAPNSTENATSSSFSKIRIIDAEATEETVLEGKRVSVSTTVENVGNATTNQTILLKAGNTTITERHVRIEPDETRQVSLTRLNTSTLETGRQLFSVTTATDTALFSLNIESRKPLEEFISNVRDRSSVVRSSRIVDENHVELTFKSDENHIDRYRKGLSDPVPQATAFEMASNPNAPEQVTLILPGEIDEPRWQSTLTKSLAERYANQSITPAEFRAELDENATGFESQFDPRFYPEEFTYATGDRARKAYVEELAQRLNNSVHGNLTVTDYGLYNETISLPDSTRMLGPNASIYVEFEVPREETQMEYRGFSSTDGGVRVFETIFKWGNLSHSEKYGEIPESVRLKFVNSEGKMHQSWDIPTFWSQQGAGGGVDGVLAIYKRVTFSSLGNHHNLDS